MAIKKSFTKKYLFAGATLGAGITTLAVRKCQRDKAAVIAKLEVASQMLPTAFGPIETAVTGEGPAVVVLHGAGGGYDMGLQFAFPDKGFKFISISRPGYLRTPLEAGPTFQEQADILAAVLDRLGVEKTAVIGTSAGGPVSIEFALRYPDRCWGLSLISAVNAPFQPAFNPVAKIARAILPHTDLPIWLMRYSPVIPYLLGPRLRDQLRLSPDNRKLLHSLLDTMFPVSRRAAGVSNDIEQIKHLNKYPLEQIKTPTLVFHGDADRGVPFVQGENSAARIPGAEFFPVSGGDHLCYITHNQTTEPALVSFLNQHAPH